MNESLRRGRKDITQGWEFWDIYLERKIKKVRNHYNAGYSNLVTQPRTSLAEQGFNFADTTK